MAGDPLPKIITLRFDVCHPDHDHRPVALVEEALEEAVAVVARDRLLEGVHVPLAPARRARQAWRRGRLGP